MEGKLTDTLRVGKISAIHPERGTAEVTFEDRGDLVSGELPIVMPFTQKDQAYFMPSVQERVLCVFDPGAPASGYIQGSFYADSRPPPDGDGNKVYIHFEDGGKIEYDKSTHTLTIKATTLVIEADIVHTGNMDTSGTHVDSVGKHS